MPKLIDHVRAAVTGDDAERLAKRREIKLRLAELETVASRHRAIGDQIRALNQREDSAVAEHQKTCQPIQAKLETIESEITSAILSGEPVSDRLAKQRADALDKLATANSKLEAEVEALKKLRRQAEQERGKLNIQIAEIPSTRNQLTAAGVADPGLLLQRFVANQAMNWAQSRLGSANKGLESAQVSLATQQRERESRRGVNSRGEVYHEPEVSEHELRLEREVDRWLAEVEAAEQAVADTTANLHRARKAILDE